MAKRLLSEVAYEIQQDWKHPYFGAVPYLNAMLTMGSIKENYGFDPGYEIVSYFLANAASWRGDVARRVKAELKAMLKEA